MSNIFDNMLKDSESIFKNSIALDYDYQPKLVPFRENEQHFIADCIKPLLQNMNGKNLFISGKPGIGKTIATKNVLKDLGENTDEVQQIYINCWKKDTPYKIVLEICDKIGYKWIQQKKTDELFQKVKEILNKTCTVFVLDEIDKLQDVSIIYSISEDIYKKSIIFITNEKGWLNELDERLRSRLTPKPIEFEPYTREQTREILKQRTKYAFHENIFDTKAFELIANKAYELKDIRTGLFLLKEAALITENNGLRKVSLEDAEESIDKLINFTSKDKNSLADDEKEILELIKNNSGKSIKELYEIYSNTKDIVYRTFQKKIKKLEISNQITSKENIDNKGYYKTVEFGQKRTLDDF